MTEGFKKILLTLRIVMPILFVLIGIYALIYPEKIQLQPEYTKMFAYIVIAYGFLRGYRAYKDIKNKTS